MEVFMGEELFFRIENYLIKEISRLQIDYDRLLISLNSDSNEKAREIIKDQLKEKYVELDVMRRIDSFIQAEKDTLKLIK